MSPELSDEMIARGLENAITARRVRAAVKRELRAGAYPLRCVIAADKPWRRVPDGPVMRMKVRELLLALPRVGPVRADKYLRDAGIAPGKRVGGLGLRQVEKLLSLVEGPSWK